MQITGNFPAGTDALSALVKTDANVETYMGEQYRLEHRTIASFIGPDTKVWCWEVLTGPAKGQYGGKRSRKADARKWARHAIREIGPINAAATEIREMSDEALATTLTSARATMAALSRRGSDKAIKAAIERAQALEAETTRRARPADAPFVVGGNCGSNA